MSAIGLPAWRLVAGRSRLQACAWAGLGALAAGVPACWMWGFTVDDALISVRYARHLAAGLGWRFNAGGPVTDGVTPLPWPVVLAVFARADALTVLAWAKGLGLVVCVAAGVALGVGAGRSAAPAWARVGALAVLAVSVPVAAHAVSGMETAVATSLATFAALSVRRPVVAALLAGLAASLRPEMGAWAIALSLGAALAVRSPARQAAAAAALSLAPFVVCTLTRMAVWGSPRPLALLAKPSDLAHGLAYVGAGCVVTLTPFLVLAPVSLRRAPLAAAIVAAGAVHVAVVAIVGGDWMPYARLLAPVAPSLAWAGILLGERAAPWATALRTALAVVVGLVLLPRAQAGRVVGSDRAALVAFARPALRDVRRMASLDVGWPSAATEADIVDLGGITDPSIAVLPGGATSKRVDAMMLLSKNPDAVLLYAPRGLPGGGDLAMWQKASFPRAVEARLAHDEAIARHFAPTAWLPLGPSGAGYVLLRGRAGE